MTEGLNLSPRHREKIEALVREYLPDVEAWVYGSRVNGRSHDGSDLDLVLRGPKLAEIDAPQLAEFTEALQDSTISFLVEARDWARLPEQFRNEVERHHVVLVAANWKSVPNEVEKEYVVAEGEAKKSRGVGGQWCERRWGDLATLEYGRALRGHNMGTGSIRVFGTNGPIGWHDRALCPHPSVIIGRKGAYRGVHYSPQPFYVIDTAFYLKTKAEADVRWAYYTLLTQDINGLDSGSAIPSTSRKDFYALPVSVPPLTEQRGIAHILGTLDDKIELTRRMNETLEAMARALFKSWFVDFDPVRAKMAGRDTGLPKEIADLFPDRLVDSDSGKIPEGWEVSTIGDHIVNFDAKRIPVSGPVRAARRGPYPYHGAAGVLDHVDEYIFDGVYLLLGEDGSVMRENGLAVTQYVWGKFWVNNHAHVLQGAGTVSTEQAYLHFSFEPVAPLVTGAVQPKLSQSRMNRVPFVFAGDGICRAFTRVVQPCFARLRSCAEETKFLAAVRDALLPRLVSGELRVSGLETE